MPSKKSVIWEELNVDQALDVLDSGSQFPSSNELICIIHQCRKRKDFSIAKRVSAHIWKHNIEVKAVGNHVVPMLVDCGNVQDAHTVFDELKHRNVHSWTSLIGGYAQCGQFGDALKLYHKMQEDQVSPNRCTILALMKGCVWLEEIQAVHEESRKDKFDEDLFIGSALVDAYIKCGSLFKGREALDKLPIRNVVSWNALIAGNADQGHEQEAIHCFRQMEQENIYPDVVTFACILKACSAAGALGNGTEMYMEITRRGVENDLVIANTLIDMYANCNMMLEAQLVFNRLVGKSVVSWNALIGGYAEHGPAWKVLGCLQQMQSTGASCSCVTFIFALKACGSMQFLNEGHKLHMEISKGSITDDGDSFLITALVDMYAKCGALIESCHLLYKVKGRCVVSWNALIAGCAERGLGEEALTCFEKLKQLDVSPNDVTFVSVLKACGSLRIVEKGQKLHVEIAAKGFDKEITIGTGLVDMYAKCSLLLDAQKVFNKLLIPYVVSWTALVSGYAEHELGEEALDCFDAMQHKGILANDAVYAPLLKACGCIGSVVRDREIFLEIVKRGYDKDLFIGNTLVDMYAKCSSLLDARKAFESLSIKGVVSWNAMIRGYGINHEAKLALDVFETMREQCVKPDAVTFTCVLDACSHASLVYKGLELFKLMKEVYHIVPTEDHYACMVDLLARAGCLHAAEKFLSSMPCVPSWDTRIALLSSCKNHADFDVGERCFRQLVAVNPKKAGPYMLMESMYGNVVMWDKAYEVAELRKEAKAKKKPATAVIEANGILQEFIIGVTKDEQLMLVMRTLTIHLESEGHVPNIDLVLKSMMVDM